MSFGFQFFGDKANVEQKVAGYSVSGDASQLKEVQALVANIVKDLSLEALVFVEASGHHDYSDPTRPNANIQFKLIVKSKDSTY